MVIVDRLLQNCAPGMLFTCRGCKGSPQCMCQLWCHVASLTHHAVKCISVQLLMIPALPCCAVDTGSEISYLQSMPCWTTAGQLQVIVVHSKNENKGQPHYKLSSIVSSSSTISGGSSADAADGQQVATALDSHMQQYLLTMRGGQKVKLLFPKQPKHVRHASLDSGAGQRMISGTCTCYRAAKCAYRLQAGVAASGTRMNI